MRRHSLRVHRAGRRDPNVQMSLSRLSAPQRRRVFGSGVRAGAHVPGNARNHPPSRHRRRSRSASAGILSGLWFTPDWRRRPWLDEHRHDRIESRRPQGVQTGMRNVDQRRATLGRPRPHDPSLRKIPAHSLTSPPATNTPTFPASTRRAPIHLSRNTWIPK